jgi:radical SAM superfamily enzyme YgiQ (UPF0313 family)
MLLIFPPVAKACEPPAGIAKLAGALRTRGLSCTVLDANLEGQLFLLAQPVSPSDTWTRRAVRNRARNLHALRDPRTYASPARYDRAVADLGRVLAAASSPGDSVVGLADLQHRTLSPLLSTDLLQATEHPEQDAFYRYFSIRLPEIIERSRPRMIGFSVNFLHQALSAFSMIGFVRQRFPGVPIVLGGGLVTSWMKRPGWSDPFGGLVDHVIPGPGERPLLELLGEEEPACGHGPPDYDGLPLDQYLAPGRILPYSASSGCYWSKCSFCPENAEENAYLPVPSRRARQELHGLGKRTRPVLLHLLDNSISPSLLRSLAAEPPGVPWYGFARIGPELADPDLCQELKRSGCVLLKLGLESGDQGVLDALQKGIDLATASQVLKALRSAGIAAYVYLLFGTPAEDGAAARRTLEFTARHAEAIGFLNLAVFNMPLGSKEPAACETERFSEGDLSLYTGFRHPQGWDRKNVRAFLENEFKRHPSILPILHREPPVFTSNHAAFFASP